MGKPEPLRPLRKRKEVTGNKTIPGIKDEGSETQKEESKRPRQPAAKNEVFTLGANRKAFTKKKGKIKISTSKFKKNAGKGRSTKRF